MITLRRVLILSLACNLFAVAFFLGRSSFAPPFMPPFAEPSLPFAPPPFFRPEMLFEPEEMQRDFAAIQPHFEALNALRKDFAHTLGTRPVSKAEVLEHFRLVDAEAELLKRLVQERVAEKISMASEAKRQKLSEMIGQ